MKAAATQVRRSYKWPGTDLHTPGRLLKSHYIRRYQSLILDWSTRKYENAIVHIIVYYQNICEQHYYFYDVGKKSIHNNLTYSRRKEIMFKAFSRNSFSKLAIKSLAIGMFRTRVSELERLKGQHASRLINLSPAQRQALLQQQQVSFWNFFLPNNPVMYTVRVILYDFFFLELKNASKSSQISCLVPYIRQVSPQTYTVMIHSL